MVVKKNIDNLVKNDIEPIKSDYLNIVKYATDSIESHTERIRSYENDIKNNFISIAYELGEISKGVTSGLFAYPQYCHNIYDYGLNMFGYKRTTVKNMLSIYRNCIDLEKQSLLPEFKSFGYTQLVEICSISNEPETDYKLKNLLKIVSSSDTIMQIKDLKKVVKRFRTIIDDDETIENIFVDVRKMHDLTNKVSVSTQGSFLNDTKIIFVTFDYLFEEHTYEYYINVKHSSCKFEIKINNLLLHLSYLSFGDNFKICLEFDSKVVELILPYDDFNLYKMTVAGIITSISSTLELVS